MIEGFEERDKRGGGEERGGGLRSKSFPGCCPFLLCPPQDKDRGEPGGEEGGSYEGAGGEDGVEGRKTPARVSILPGWASTHFFR